LIVSEAVLLDTNIVSELWRKRPDPGVLAFVGALERYEISALVLHELAYGVERAPAESRNRLRVFMSAWRAQIGAAILPVDAAIADSAGRLRASAQERGRILHVEDAIIAATALARGATLATRNVRDFDGLGVGLVNPFTLER